MPLTQPGAGLAGHLVVQLRRVGQHRLSDPENSYSGVAWLGAGPPLVIGVFIFVGVIFSGGGRPGPGGRRRAPDRPR